MNGYSWFLMFLFMKTAAGADVALQACSNLLVAEDDKCCDSLKIFKSLDEAEKECAKDSKEITCDYYKCILEKKGLLKGDTLDDEATKVFFAAVADEYPEEKGVVKKMEENCYNGKNKDFDLLDANCPILNFYICAYINALLECTSWKSMTQCQKISEDAKTCKVALSQYGIK
ncbi:uncharacterized protein LOC123706934 [Pieris brassicae]|uniref:uncharacterized protein LOC123706934 n=1 Tax=Pieris brassicae TaxID=7116 RepID=UPI001E65F29A|nr:uncharacterized protein LOC123706934 [Pieris brassicae]